MNEDIQILNIIRTKYYEPGMVLSKLLERIEEGSQEGDVPKEKINYFLRAHFSRMLPRDEPPEPTLLEETKPLLLPRPLSPPPLAFHTPVSVRPRRAGRFVKINSAESISSGDASKSGAESEEAPPFNSLAKRESSGRKSLQPSQSAKKQAKPATDHLPDSVSSSPAKRPRRMSSRRSAVTNN